MVFWSFNCEDIDVTSDSTASHSTNCDLISELIVLKVKSGLAVFLRSVSNKITNVCTTSHEIT